MAIVYFNKDKSVLHLQSKAAIIRLIDLFFHNVTPYFYFEPEHR